MKIQFVITYDQSTGQVQIQGPVENKVLVYGLMELVKDAVRQASEAAQKNGGLVVARQALPVTPPKNGVH